MELAALHQEIAQRIEKIDFSALWKGFSLLKFALYTSEECCLDGEYIQKTSAFCGNTAIPWQNGYIAIWGISEEPEDLDALSASIIHEMFHAFQRLARERQCQGSRKPRNG